MIKIQLASLLLLLSFAVHAQTEYYSLNSPDSNVHWKVKPQAETGQPTAFPKRLSVKRLGRRHRAGDCVQFLCGRRFGKRSEFRRQYLSGR